MHAEHTPFFFRTELNVDPYGIPKGIYTGLSLRAGFGPRKKKAYAVHACTIDKKEGCCGIKKNILFLKDNQIRLEKTSKDSDV